MNNQLESALVIELADAIKWAASLAPTATDGSLTTVDLNAPLDITKYARRDRELAYRDIVNATAIVRVALHADTVWNADVIRPPLQGITSGNLPYSPGDTGRVDSTVVHVKNVSLPKDALSTDQDLMGRDQLVYEVLVKACSIFTDPPLTTSGASIPSQTAWSQAEGVDYATQPSPALPLNRDAFKLSDVTLAERDNEVAAYAAKVCQLLKNPFAYATRLYVRVDGTDARDSEVYTLIRVYYQVGVVYDVGAEVFYQTGWYRAITPTSNAPTSADWISIAAPTLRIWTAEPALPFRNRIVYDTNLKTLRWFRETAETIQVPQLFALSIPGMFFGQTVTTVPSVPERKDAQFWRQKASRISYSGTMATPLVSIPDTTILSSGVVQTDTVGLTAPSVLDVAFNTPLQKGHRYRVSALMRPSQSVEIFASHNLFGVPGTNQGVDFIGIYKPTLTLPGSPVKYSLVLPPGNWTATLEYTNLSGSTAGFGVRVEVDGLIVKDDTAPFLFQDSAGNSLTNGTLVTSDVIPFVTTGLAQTMAVTWTYGQGALSVHKIRLFSADRFEGEYYFQTQIFDGSNVIQKEVATMESTGRKGIYEIAHFDFDAVANATNPHVRLTWLQSSELPIQFRQFSLSELNQTFATPGIEGFEAFKWECIRRAERSVQAAFTEHSRNSLYGTVPDFTTDGTQWNAFSSDDWMSFIETNEPRLREIQNVDVVVVNRQYEVSGSYVVYNGGTYGDSATFFGTTVTDFVPYHGAVLNQLGAFRLSLPSDMGAPGLLPLGLEFVTTGTGAIVQENLPIDQVPTIAAMQPWMVEAGLYVVDDDFLSPMALSNTNETKSPPLPPIQHIIPGNLRCPVVTSFPIINWSPGQDFYAAFDSTRRYLWVANQVYSGSTAAVDVISTVTNSYVTSYIGSASFPQLPFSTISIVYDGAHDMIVMVGQAFGWETLDPTSGNFHFIGNFGGGLINDAGVIYCLAYDNNRGHTMFVARNVGVNGGFEVISIINATTYTVEHNTTYALPKFGIPAFSTPADKFIIGNRDYTGTVVPFYYVNPVSYAVTPSAITTGAESHGDVFAFDNLNAVVYVNGTNVLTIANPTTDTVIKDTGIPMTGGRVRGATYNSCKGLLYVSDGAMVYAFDAINSYGSVSQTLYGAYGLYFDDFSNLVYAVDASTTQIKTF